MAAVLMGIVLRRRAHVTGRTWLNVSGSGVSVSHRRGRVTGNSRGTLFVRLARGLYWRS